MRRTSTPDLRAADADPFHTASTTCLPVSPWFVWSSGAHRTSA